MNCVFKIFQQFLATKTIRNVGTPGRRIFQLTLEFAIEGLKYLFISFPATISLRHHVLQIERQ